MNKNHKTIKMRKNINKNHKNHKENKKVEKNLKNKKQRKEADTKKIIKVNNILLFSYSFISF